MVFYKHLKSVYNSKNYCSFDIFVLGFSSQNYLKNTSLRGNAVVLGHLVYNEIVIDPYLVLESNCGS